MYYRFTDLANMSKDLDYFKESDFGKGNFTTFYNNLPSSELKVKFLNSFPSSHPYFRPPWVYQGYKGPDPNGESGESEKLLPISGLQEVRFWWGPSKHINWVPLLGTAVWSIGKVVSNATGLSDWHSLYFDEKTGEFLSHDKEAAASKLNDTGLQLFDSGKYEEAKEYFRNACVHSTNKENYNAFRINDNKVQAEIDRMANLNCEEANESEQSECDNGQVKSEEAQAEIDAINLNSEGDILFEQRKYKEALNKYEEAHDKSQVETEYIKYRSNMDKAQAEGDAMDLNCQGDLLFEQGKYSEAQSKYQEAYNKSKIKREYSAYKGNERKAKTEINALNLKEEGDSEFSAGRYENAKDKYEQASNDSSVTANKTAYANCAMKAQIELNAFIAYQNGEKLFREGNYSNALEKFQAAYSNSMVEDAKSIYYNGIIKVQVEIKAHELFEEGEKLYMARNYSESKMKYNEAVEISQVNKNNYNENGVAKAQVELDAIELFENGNRLFRQKDFVGALDKYQAAHDKAQNEKEKNKYIINMNDTQAEIDAVKLNSEGDEFFEQGKYGEACSKYEKAYDKSLVSKNVYKTNRDKAEYKTVLTDFQIMITQDCSDKELEAFSAKLKMMINEGCKSDPEIKNRSNVISFRIARKEMMDQLKSSNLENINQLLRVIMNSIETEMDLLKILNISDEKLQLELELLLEKFNDLDSKTNRNDNIEVDISSISPITKAANEKKNRTLKSLEKLSQNTQQEYGN
jgi:tetratricopeptide (TPR) repeat protein